MVSLLKRGVLEPSTPYCILLKREGSFTDLKAGCIAINNNSGILYSLNSMAMMGTHSRKQFRSYTDIAIET